MDGKLFLGTARFLKNNGADEAAFRSAISRAYYACFLEMRQVAFDNCCQDVRLKAGIRKVSNIGHEPLQKYLKSSSEGIIKELGEDLAGLCGNRHDADYHMMKTCSCQDAQDAIDEAEIIFNNLKQIRPAEIGKAMENKINMIYS